MQFPWVEASTNYGIQPQTSELAEKYNRTLTNRLWNYMAEKQRNGDIFAQPVTYEYNWQVNRSILTILISLVLLRQ